MTERNVISTIRLVAGGNNPGNARMFRRHHVDSYPPSMCRLRRQRRVAIERIFAQWMFYFRHGWPRTDELSNAICVLQEYAFSQSGTATKPATITPVEASSRPERCIGIGPSKSAATAQLINHAYPARLNCRQN